MERRELLKMIALVTGSALIGGEFLLSGCSNENAKLGGTSFSDEDIQFLDEVGETILPRTSSPGAKDAKVGEFMRVMVNDCYDADDQKTFHEGISLLNKASEKKFKKSFMEASPEERTELLKEIDADAKKHQQEKSEKDKQENEKAKEEKAKGNNDYKKVKNPGHYFTMMKQLTLLGFFTSKPGATEALRHVAVPGRYDGNLPYKKGDRAWA